MAGTLRRNPPQSPTARTGADRRVSEDFLKDTQSIYHLVDIIDQLFDGVIETEKS